MHTCPHACTDTCTHTYLPSITSPTRPGLGGIFNRARALLARGTPIYTHTHTQINKQTRKQTPIHTYKRTKRSILVDDRLEVGVAQPVPDPHTSGARRNLISSTARGHVCTCMHTHTQKCKQTHRRTQTHTQTNQSTNKHTSTHTQTKHDILVDERLEVGIAQPVPRAPHVRGKAELDLFNRAWALLAHARHRELLLRLLPILRVLWTPYLRIFQ